MSRPACRARLSMQPLLVLAAGLALLAGMPCAAGAGEQVFPGRTAVPAPTRQGHVRHAYYVPMADGVRLAITVYTPADAAAAERFPVLLWYLPGHRESIDPKTGRIFPAWSSHDLEFFTSHGYALAAAEMRGSGASFGSRELDRGPQIGRDGKQLVDWIAAQPWSNGAVGMVGASYQGFTQYATAAERPAALRAIFPEIAGFDDYTSMFNPGGIPNLALTGFASDSIVRDDLNEYDASAGRPRFPSVPVVDEDGDGELADEIPLDRNGNGNFLDDGQPTYADGRPRQDLYYLATLDHLRNANLTLDVLKAAPFRDSRVGGTPYTYRDIDPDSRPQRIAASGIAVYNRGGWFDYHARDTVMWQATLAGHVATHLMMAPTGHGGFPAAQGEELYRSGPYFNLFGDSATQATLDEEKLRFFDHYLRGVDNGFDRLPPVLIYVMGSGWRAEREWPLARQRPTEFYFADGGALARSAGAPGEDHYHVDPAADSRSNGANRWNYGVSAAAEPLTLSGSDAGRQLYATAPLATDTEVTGHPLVTIHLSSDTTNADVYAYLEDVAPDGHVLLVTEGELRGNYFRNQPIQAMFAGMAGAPEVRPSLPWHGFEAADFVADPFLGRAVRALSFDLLPTSWLFKAGHRIRIALAGADSPSFAAPVGAGKGATWTIHRGRGLSHLTLPVIPAAHPG